MCVGKKITAPSFNSIYRGRKIWIVFDLKYWIENWEYHLLKAVICFFPFFDFPKKMILISTFNLFPFDPVQQIQIYLIMSTKWKWSCWVFHTYWNVLFLSCNTIFSIDIKIWNSQTKKLHIWVKYLRNNPINQSNAKFSIVSLLTSAPN